jgi:hypothetical protein
MSEMPLPLARQVSEVCDRFEDQWKTAGRTGQRPRIEEYLPDTSPQQREALVRELVLLDVDYRRLAGENPAVEEYGARFPELDEAWLRTALRPEQRAAAEAVTVVEEGPPADSKPGGDLPATLGGYRLLRRLGGGGMGTVFEAEDCASGRHVAIKSLTPELADSADAIARFRAEGRLASAISHPRCVFVFAADEDAGRPYIIMELMPGETLADLVKRQGPLPPQQAVAYMLDVLEGLQEAHRAGVIHRDVKPSNCFLGADGRVKIGDFGLSKSLGSSAHVTRTGTFLGTPLFASPEQIKAQPVDARTDIYSAAATLYYLLAGQAPFEGGDAMAVMARIVSESPPSIRALRPEVSPGLERVLLRGLERDPSRRPSTVEEFRLALLPSSPKRYAAGIPRWRIGAHLIDGFLFMLLGVDVGLFGAFVQAGIVSGPGALFVLWTALWIGYFTVLEGLWGCSLGKLLFGLRVCVAGGSNPPGLVRGFVRTLVHFSIVYLAGSVLELKGYTVPKEEQWRWSVADILVTTLGALLLFTTMRRRNGYRGPHEWLSGTCTIMLPRSDGEDLATESRPSRADQTAELPAGVPQRLGPFTVRTAQSPSSRHLSVLGADLSLGREVSIELRPLSEPPLPAPRRDLHRVARLRWLASGTEGQWQWDAFLAPQGVPVAELVGARGPLWWHQARPLLAHLAEELSAACADGTLPPVLHLDQVWVRPGGGVLLLDGPPTDTEKDKGPAQLEGDERALALLRETAVVLLDRGGPAPAAPPRLWKRLALRIGTLGFVSAGIVVFFKGSALLGSVLLLLGAITALWLARVVRHKIAYARRKRIRSPLPEHADALLARLLGGQNPYATVAGARADLESPAERPARVTTKMRLAHLATLAMLLGPCLTLMFVFSRSLNGVAVAVLADEITVYQKALLTLDSGRLGELASAHLPGKSTLAVFVDEPPASPGTSRSLTSAEIAKRFSEPDVHRTLEQALKRQTEELERRLNEANFMERSWLPDHEPKPEEVLAPDRKVDLEGFNMLQFLQAVYDARLKTRRPELAEVYAFSREEGTEPSGYPQLGGPGLFAFMLILILIFPVCWILWAFLWRGGLTRRFMGLALVTASGHGALRVQCAWRALLVWAPIGFLGCVTAWLEAYHPQLVPWSWACWGAALLVLLCYVAAALRWPARGLHDRLAGTYHVPR